MRKRLRRWRAWLKMRLTRICRFSARRICPLNGRASIRFSAWLGIVSSMKLPRSCSASSRLRTVWQPASRPPSALSTANIFRLETAGVAIVCLIYMDASGPAHMRYSVRRLRRKLPKATIILGCWLKDMDPAALENLREGAKADLAAASLGGALKLCIEATGAEDHSLMPKHQFSTTTAA